MVTCSKERLDIQCTGSYLRVCCVEITEKLKYWKLLASFYQYLFFVCSDLRCDIYADKTATWVTLINLLHIDNRNNFSMVFALWLQRQYLGWITILITGA